VATSDCKTFFCHWIVYSRHSSKTLIHQVVKQVSHWIIHSNWIQVVNYMDNRNAFIQRKRLLQYRCPKMMHNVNAFTSGIRFSISQHCLNSILVEKSYFDVSCFKIPKTMTERFFFWCSQEHLADRGKGMMRKMKKRMTKMRMIWRKWLMMSIKIKFHCHFD